ncbi:hypothetical protein CPB84DRAFT_1843532 [Gymnopilus junonius]|uniref:F-box domain-containing protein n=1 Tax=Gymnopilus junonius TaxID=109634 RepID=A0A9P5TR53_GYMJU|nr:hypothetical protein CPB84DRAFT_1843532 [Gymnopilus junonius]
MQSNPSAVIVTRLFEVHDLILTIVALAMNMHATETGDEPQHPLTVLVCLSHVCSPWRNIILDASYLWGRAFDLAYLQKSSRQNCRDEVLKRSGNSNIRAEVQINVLVKNNPFKSFLTELMQNNWERIEILDIGGTGLRMLKNGDPLLTALLNAFQRPAPRLKKFRVLDISLDVRSP